MALQVRCRKCATVACFQVQELGLRQPLDWGCMSQIQTQQERAARTISSCGNLHLQGDIPRPRTHFLQNSEENLSPITRKSCSPLYLQIFFFYRQAKRLTNCEQRKIYAGAKCCDNRTVNTWINFKKKWFVFFCHFYLETNVSMKTDAFNYLLTIVDDGFIINEFSLHTDAVNYFFSRLWHYQPYTPILRKAIYRILISGQVIADQ